jgi:hypothetical protein
VSTIESGADGSRPAHEGDRSPVESTRDNLHVLTMNEALGTIAVSGEAGTRNGVGALSSEKRLHRIVVAKWPTRNSGIT